MFERFTERARQVVVLAQDEAKLARDSKIAVPHLFTGLIREDEGIAARVMEGLGIGDLDRARSLHPPVDADAQAPHGQIPFTPESKQVLELALREALSMGHNYIGTEHILMALTRVMDEAQIGAPIESVRDAVLEALMRRGRPREGASEVVEPSAMERVPPGFDELEDELDKLGSLQSELALRGFYSSVTTYRVNFERHPFSPGGRPLGSMTGWHGRLNVAYELFDRQAMDVLAGLAADHGCSLEWSMKHGATFRVQR